MNGQVITNHGTPTNPLEVANKQYVDSVSGGGGGGIPVTTVNLIDQNYTLVLNTLSGSLLILVKNLVSGGPSATFLASKSESYMEASISRLTTSSGNASNERLRIKWDINSGISLRKTGNNYNGQYYVKYILI